MLWNRSIRAFRSAHDYGHVPLQPMPQAAIAVRKQRVKQRNADKNPSLYSFEITDFMFDFMEGKFEPTVDPELINGRTIILDDVDLTTHAN